MLLNQNLFSRFSQPADRFRQKFPGLYNVDPKPHTYVIVTQQQRIPLGDVVDPSTICRTYGAGGAGGAGRIYRIYMIFCFSQLPDEAGKESSACRRREVKNIRTSRNN